MWLCKKSNLSGSLLTGARQIDGWELIRLLMQRLHKNSNLSEICPLTVLCTLTVLLIPSFFHVRASKIMVKMKYCINFHNQIQKCVKYFPPASCNSTQTQSGNRQYPITMTLTTTTNYGTYNGHIVQCARKYWKQ